MVLPLTAMLLGLVAMKTTPSLQFTGGSLFSQTEDISQQLKQAQDSISFSVKVKKLKNPKHYELIGPLEGEKLVAQLGELQYEFSDIQTTEDYIKVRGLIQTLRNNSRMTKNYTGIRTPSQVEVKAEPRISFVEWQKLFLSTLEIPEREQSYGLLDKLTLELIVTESGKISDVVVKNSIGAGLDQQALTLFQDERFNQWNAARVQGKAVASLTQVTFYFHPDIPAETRASLDFFNPSGNSRTFAQDAIIDPLDPFTVFDVVENPPSFKGGMDAFYEYIQANKHYSEAAQRMGIEGNVYVAFVIDRDGKVKNPELLRGVMDELDMEAIRLIENSPDWNPGSQKGQAVNVRMRIPIRFKLDQATSKQVSGLALATNQSGAGVNIAEVRPSDAFNEFLKRNLKYPAESRKNGVSGIVHTELTLDKDGFIKSITIRETPNKELYSEVMWTMGQNRERWIVKGGNQEEYNVQMPIAFNLPDLQQTTSSGHPFEIKVVGYGGVSSTNTKDGQINLKGTAWNLNAQDGLKFSSTQQELPVFVINGVVKTQDYLNKKIDPNTIETIEIVKGERAASMKNLYGNGASNGIIFIELKK
jgi:TonB family protein